MAKVWNNSTDFVTSTGNGLNGTTGASNQCYLTIALGFEVEPFSRFFLPGKVYVLHY